MISFTDILKKLEAFLIFFNLPSFDWCVSLITYCFYVYQLFARHTPHLVKNQNVASYFSYIFKMSK